MKPEVSLYAEIDFRELFEKNGKLAVRYIETLQAVIAAQDKCIRAHDRSAERRNGHSGTNAGLAAGKHEKRRDKP